MNGTFAMNQRHIVEKAHEDNENTPENNRNIASCGKVQNKARTDGPYDVGRTSDSDAAGIASGSCAAGIASNPNAAGIASGSCAVNMIEVARSVQEADTTAFDDPGTIKLIAPAKVNLYLDIGKKRDDGYHEVLTVMHTLLLHDVIRMRSVPRLPGEGLALEVLCRACEGLDPLRVPPEDNLVSKAIRQLAVNTGGAHDQTIVIDIEKHIPVQAGLGGGSSDAAAALVGAARLWGLSPHDEIIEKTARTLGADVAFFLHGGCACLTGVGDTIDHHLSPMNTFVVIVKPQGGVSTTAAYAAFDKNPYRLSSFERTRALTAACARDVPLCNNLVFAAKTLLPALEDVCAWVGQSEGVEASLMSGSGSAVFGICGSFEEASRVASQAQSCGWWARATMFSPLSAAIVPL